MKIYEDKEGREYFYIGEFDIKCINDKKEENCVFLQDLDDDIFVISSSEFKKNFRFVEEKDYRFVDDEGQNHLYTYLHFKKELEILLKEIFSKNQFGEPKFNKYLIPVLLKSVLEMNSYIDEIEKEIIEETEYN